MDEAARLEMYARLCRKIMEQISPSIQDESTKGTNGRPIAGGQLFRKYLLNLCQDDFERGWATRQAPIANADEDEDVLYSEVYHAEQKAKRRWLGLVKFIGELFKLQMLTERIMHECVKKLLGDVDSPKEEDIEGLCALLSTVGQLLETQRAGPYIDIYFTRMRELSKNPKVSSRLQDMLLEVNELRQRNWIPRNQATASVGAGDMAEIYPNSVLNRFSSIYERTSLQDFWSREG